MNTKLPVIITLSNESDFSIDNHLQSLIVNKHISSFQLFGKRDECLRRLVIVLVDGASHNVNFRFNGKRSDITLSFDKQKSDFPFSKIKDLIVALQPLWAGVGDTQWGCGLVCSSLAHLTRIPSFTRFSFWSTQYNILFSDKLAQLEQFDFCEVDECDGGFWIEFSAEDVETYHKRRRIIEQFLVSDGNLWDDGNAGSNAVWLSLHNGKNLGQSIIEKDQWKISVKDNAKECKVDILKIADEVVANREKKLRVNDNCAVLGYEDGSIDAAWMEGSSCDVSSWINRSMSAGMVVWAAVVSDINCIPPKKKISHYKVSVYDSCMSLIAEEQVNSCF